MDSADAVVDSADAVVDSADAVAGSADAVSVAVLDSVNYVFSYSASPALSDMR